MRAVDDLLTAAADVPFALAIVVAAVGLARVPASGRGGPAELAAALALALEFLLAAGLLRLSAIDDFTALGAVAAIVLLRKLIATGLRLALRALGSARPQRIRA
jgi:uncharacterized membrane protein